MWRFACVLLLSGCIAQREAGDAATARDAEMDAAAARGGASDVDAAASGGRCPHDPDFTGGSRIGFQPADDADLGGDHGGSGEATVVETGENFMVLSSDVQGMTGTWRLDGIGAAGIAPGQRVWLEAWSYMPFWVEGFAVVRESGDGPLLGMTLDGSPDGSWSGSFREPDLAVRTGDECPVRSAGCGDVVDQALVFRGSGAPVALFGGESGRVEIGGRPYMAIVVAAFTAGPHVTCSDTACQWADFTVTRAR